MIKNDLIKKAKKLGFKSYFELIELDINKNCYHLWLHDLQKWLRDNYNIDIEIRIKTKGIDNQKIGYQCFIILNNKALLIITEKTYEQVLEEGLKKALILIEKK